MKKMIIALLLVCGTTHAETWFEAVNKGGGKILLLMTKCDNKTEGRIVIATSSEGISSTGCWFFFADMVHVAWNDGNIKTSSFDPDIFVKREQ